MKGLATRVARPALPDLALPGLVAVVGLSELVLGGLGPPVPFLAGYLLAAAALCWRQSLAALTPLVVAACATGSSLLGGERSFLNAASWLLPPALACYAAGRYTPLGRLWLAAVSVLTAMIIMYTTLVHLVGFNADVLFGLIVYLGPWVAGIAVLRAVERSAALATEAERQRGLRAQSERDAVHRERIRLGSEVHDLMAHSLTAMVVQAALAQDRLACDPDGAAEAIRAVQQRGRDALASTRELIRGMRESDPVQASADAGEAGSEEIAQLLEQFREMGLVVHERYSSSCQPADLTRPVLRTLVTVLQEALTNALRHAPSRAVEVSLDRVGGALDVRVRNLPRVAVGPVHDHEALHRQGFALGAGVGLLGLHDRLASVGGALEISANEPERFALRVRIPAWTAGG